MEKETIFRKQSIQPGDTALLPCNNFLIGVKREKEGWFLRVFEENTASDTIQAEEISSGEYFQSGKSNSLVISPALPSKPLVFKGNKMMIAPHQRMTFFVKIPLVLQVYFSKVQAENLLKEIPSARLSDTWFGEPDSGVPAYSIGNEYFLSFSDMKVSEYEAICPISIFNDWDQTLEVQRLIIKTDNLPLYKNNNQLVTGVVKLEYKGQDSISSVAYGTSKQFHGENPETVAKPRTNDLKGLLKANFHFIRNIYRFE